jgi:hypothetical protein
VTQPRLGFTRPDNFTPWAGVDPLADDPAQRLTYFLGAHRPPWISQAPVPVFLSLAPVVRYQGRDDAWPLLSPVGAGNGPMVYAIDSGAFTALDSGNPDHPWHLGEDSYAELVQRVIFHTRVTPMFVAAQDRPCEPELLAKTGRDVRRNIFETVENFCYLSENHPDEPWLPTLQGWTPDDYVMCAEVYEQYGVDLGKYRNVGLGSVCRRGAEQTANVIEVVKTLAPLRLNLHGFGMSIDALRVCAPYLTSADSTAWSLAARRRQLRLDGCEHVGDCRNCLSWALAWRETVFDAIRAGDPAQPPVELARMAAADVERLRRELAAAERLAALYPVPAPAPVAPVVPMPAPRPAEQLALAI